MSNHSNKDTHGKSKLSEVALGFEYNRSFADERRITKRRGDSDLQ